MNFKNGISPSILAADYGNLGEAAIKAEKGGASSLHLDYMDGHYVPNISYGLDLIPALKKRVAIPLIAHLMISNADERMKDFIQRRPDCIVIQEDAVSDPLKTINEIKKAKIEAGIAINPDRELRNVYNLLRQIDYLIVLSVFPGFGGQTNIETTLKKMKEAHKFRFENKLKYNIAVDGGVNAKTAKRIAETGANVLIAGTAIYGKDNVKESIENLLKIIDGYSPAQ